MPQTGHGRPRVFPLLISAWGTKQLWRLVRARKQGKHRGRTKIRRLAHKLHIPHPMSCSLEEAEQNFQDACRTHSGCKPLAGTMQHKFLETRQVDPSLTKEQQKCAQQLLLCECACTACRQICPIKGHATGQAIRAVGAPPLAGQEGPTARLNTLGAIVQAIMDMMQTCYCLTESTPLMQPETQSELGFLGGSPLCQAILAVQQVKLPVQDQHTQALLRLLHGQGHQPPTRTASPAATTNYTGTKPKKTRPPPSPSATLATAKPLR